MRTQFIPDYNLDFDRAERLTEREYRNADPRTVRAALRRMRQSGPDMVNTSGTWDGTIVTLANIAAERGIQV